MPKEPIIAVVDDDPSMWRALSLPTSERPILMPTRKPSGRELTREQQLDNEVRHKRRQRIEHVNSSVKRCRIVKDRLRLWKTGI